MHSETATVYGAIGKDEIAMPATIIPKFGITNMVNGVARMFKYKSGWDNFTQVLADSY